MRNRKSRKKKAEVQEYGNKYGNKYGNNKRK